MPWTCGNAVDFPPIWILWSAVAFSFYRWFITSINNSFSCASLEPSCQCLLHRYESIHLEDRFLVIFESSIDPNSWKCLFITEWEGEMWIDAALLCCYSWLVAIIRSDYEWSLFCCHNWSFCHCQPNVGCEEAVGESERVIWLMAETMAEQEGCVIKLTM